MRVSSTKCHAGIANDAGRYAYKLLPGSLELFRLDVTMKRRLSSGINAIERSGKTTFRSHDDNSSVRNSLDYPIARGHNLSEIDFKAFVPFGFRLINKHPWPQQALAYQKPIRVSEASATRHFVNLFPFRQELDQLLSYGTVNPSNGDHGSKNHKMTVILNAGVPRKTT